MKEAILILQKELEQKNLTQQEYSDYLNLFRFAADKIFKNEKHSEFRKEVDQMTSLYDQLPSVREKRLRAEIEEMRAKNEEALARKERELAEQKAELARMKELLEKNHIALTP